MKKIRFSALALAVIIGAFGALAARPIPATKTSSLDQQYDIRLSPTGPVQFTGDATAVNNWNAANLPGCTGLTIKCDYVYKSGTSVEVTGLEVLEN
ncbi:MAG: hypothetical protein JST13_07790 [Bacteroidetes bacterium]|nr:hypothetical protein [Bacteroidota bacterium]